MRTEAVLVLGLLGVVAPLPAQDAFGFGGGRGRGGPPPVSLDANLPYDGHFEFLRVRYATPGGLRSRDVKWSHDYARAEANFTKILREVSTVRTRTTASAVLGFDDPALFEHTIAYIVEVGYWVPNDSEVQALQRWLRRGGFLIVDDFQGRDLTNFEAQMQRVLPDARLLPVPTTHPVFDAFYHFTEFDEVRHPYGGMITQYWGIFEENDPTKRLMVIANHNGDIAEYWEFADQGLFQLGPSNDAFKLGVNYIVYGLTR
ncbi:MAG: DUF4159 domain-containing protein [Gemmatimonadales bacterium]